MIEVDGILFRDEYAGEERFDYHLSVDGSHLLCEDIDGGGEVYEKIVESSLFTFYQLEDAFVMFRKGDDGSLGSVAANNYFASEGLLDTLEQIWTGKGVEKLVWMDEKTVEFIPQFARDYEWEAPIEGGFGYGQQVAAKIEPAQQQTETSPVIVSQIIAPLEPQTKVKADSIHDLYAETVLHFSANAYAWESFLESAGRNYKLPFDEQVLIYRQRPNATAVLELNKWNERFGRWVNKGARGIAVFGKPGTRSLRHYFDISDTHANAYSRPVPVWDMAPGHAQSVIEVLENAFDVSAEGDQLGSVLVQVASVLTADNVNDYLDELVQIKATSSLRDTADSELSELFAQTVSASVACCLTRRLGETLPAETQQIIEANLCLFNSLDTINTLGCAVSDISEIALREVATCVLEQTKELQAQNRRVAEVVLGRDNPTQNQTQTKRSDDGNSLHAERGTDLSEFGIEGSGSGDARNICTDEARAPQESPPGTVHEPHLDRTAERPFDRSGEPSNTDDGDAFSSDGTTGGDRRGDEAGGLDALGGADEQHPRERERDHNEGADPNLQAPPQIQTDSSALDEAGENTSPASLVSKIDTTSLSLGTSVYIGDSLYELVELGDEKVTLFDPTSPLFPREIPRAEFNVKFNENPLNTPAAAKEQRKPPAEIKSFRHTPSRKRKAVSEVPGQATLDMSENFVITDDDLGVGGHYERLHWNMNALRVLREIEAEGRLATSEEQEFLSRYVGWGSLAKVFDDDDNSWQLEKATLKTRLTEQEYNAARASTLNAHFTSPIVIRAMYEALGNMGFATGNILEPACGTGNFFGLLPEKMKDSKLFGVELDPTTANMARLLYPKADIRLSGFEEADLPENFFDVAIGNVPFGSYSVVDKRYDAHGFLIHDYFFARSLDLVRPGGIVAFITSKGTLDKKNPKVRRYLAERADLIGAIRLPNNAFKDNAGTSVTADIIFLQKRDSPQVRDVDWIHLGLTDDGIALNSYFAEHPEMILGTMTHDNVLYYGRGDETTCAPFEGEDLGELLKGAVGNIHAQISKYEREEIEEEKATLPADPRVKNYSFTAENNKVYFRIDSKMHEMELSKTGASRTMGMVSIRDCLRVLIELQTQDAPDEEIQQCQKQLSFLYDTYTKKYGIINSRANSTAFSQDSSYALLCALEDLDDEGNLIGKADMFTKRTIRPHTPVISADTPAEALALSLSERARVDVAYMEHLTGKTTEEITSELRGVIFMEPVSGVYQTSDEYLSGNVRDKLEIAKAYANDNEEYIQNVEVLTRVIPEDIPASEISVRLGATWIPASDIQDFMTELLEIPRWRQDEIRVRYLPATAQWSISGKSRDNSNVRASSTFGTHRANAYRIIEDTLNLRDVRIFDYVVEPDGKRTAVLNKQETAIALSKQDAIKEAFKEWIFSDPTRRERLVRTYNDMFNSMRMRTFDGSHLSFPGMNPEMRLRKHQLDAIARIIYAGNTLLAHEVGAGKTFVVSAATQELKRLGLANKSLIVVPNHLTEQWASEYLKLYPAANILVATKRDFEKHNRRRFCARIATGDYDAVIIGHTQFEKIPMSLDRQREMLEREISEIIGGIAELKEQRGERYTIKQLESSRKKLEVRLKKLNDQGEKDDVIEFEQLGVDRLFIDESHYYKNLFFYTKMRNVGGIPQTEAMKSSDLFAKCRYLDEITGGKGIVFATGTPISNSMVELYTVQRYLQYQELTRLNLHHFDCWASTFGETVTAIELAPEGTGYRQKTRFAKFYNLPELMTLFRQVADIQTADMLNLPVPHVNFENVSVPPSDFQKDLVSELSVRAGKVRNRMVDATIDNMLKITNDGRKLALDQRLISPDLPDDPTSKVSVCADNIFGIWKRFAADRLTQLVFCDLSTPKRDGTFSVYNDIRSKLTEKGIPEAEIAFIHDFDTEAKKAELFGKVRSGQVRVMLGSTQKMGAGTNVQTRLVALHDLDCPWRPSDLQQRLGRIERQGNQNEEVDVFRYVTEGTFDAYLYQLVENKQRFIAQVMTSKSPVRSAADVDETALSYAELKALATGNPLIKERMDVEVEVSRLKLLKSNYLSQKYSLEDQLAKSYPQKVLALNERIKAYEADAVIVQANPSMDKDSFSMKVSDVTYIEKAEAGKAILDFIKTMKSPKPVPLGNYRGFALEVAFDVVSRSYEAVIVGALRHTAALGSDEVGVITRIDNVIERIVTDLDMTKRSLEDAEKQIENVKAEVAKPFAKEEELQSSTKRLAELDKLLDMDKVDQELVGGNESPPTTTHEPAFER